MENIIKLKNLVKNFKGQKALDNVSVNFQKGKIHGIIGRNGSGKTVMMKCICGLMHYDSGEIYIDEKKLHKDMDIPSNIGIIIENPGFLNNYSGYKNLLFLAKINGKIDKQKIKDTISLVGLDPNDKKHVGKYSLGMKQRLGIAQAIMENPDILILDEPMNGLDNQGVQDIRNLLLDLKEQGETIILASHNKEDISLLCDTVIELDNGGIVSQNNLNN